MRTNENTHTHTHTHTHTKKHKMKTHPEHCEAWLWRHITSWYICHSEHSSVCVCVCVCVCVFVCACEQLGSEFSLDVFTKQRVTDWKRKFCLWGSESEDACGLSARPFRRRIHAMSSQSCTETGQIRTLCVCVCVCVCVCMRVCVCVEIRLHTNLGEPPLISKNIWEKIKTKAFFFLLSTDMFRGGRFHQTTVMASHTLTHKHSSAIRCTDSGGSWFRCCVQLRPVPAPVSSAGSEEERNRKEDWR